MHAYVCAGALVWLCVWRSGPGTFLDSVFPWIWSSQIQLYWLSSKLLWEPPVSISPVLDYRHVPPCQSLKKKRCIFFSVLWCVCVQICAPGYRSTGPEESTRRCWIHMELELQMSVSQTRVLWSGPELPGRATRIPQRLLTLQHLCLALSVELKVWIQNLMMHGRRLI